jgi:hypothetical protein
VGAGKGAMMANNYVQNQLYAQQNQLYAQQNVGTAGIGIGQQITPYQPYPYHRNMLSEKCALAVYSNRFILGEIVLDMPGDLLRNKKLLSDVFLTEKVKMNLEQAASLAFILHEEVGQFLEVCDRVGALESTAV